jgi:hypothetical protein
MDDAAVSRQISVRTGRRRNCQHVRATVQSVKLSPIAYPAATIMFPPFVTPERVNEVNHTLG